MDARTASIIAQVAVKAAAQLASNIGEYQQILPLIHEDLISRSTLGVTEQAPAPAAAPLVDPFAGVAPAPQALQQAQANVVAAFPGAVVPAQPTGANLGTLEGRWADYMANPSNWWDNRDKGDTSQSGGIKPDFRHKNAKDDQGRAVALWLVDNKYGKHAPAAVFTSLGLTPPGAAPVAAAGGFAPTPAPGLPDPF